MPRDRSVFVSSTFIDNADRRRVVEDAVLRAELRSVGMERFTASHRPTVEECWRWARGCDVFVLIVAHRYGWIPDGHDVSITELEYDAARAASRPCFVFLIDEKKHPATKEDFDEGADRWKKQELLETFKVRVNNDQMPGLFTNTTLGAMVLDALGQWRRKEDGVVEVGTVTEPPPSALGDELARYCQAAESFHGSLGLAGFATKLRVPIDLEDLYVPLHAMLDLRAVGKGEFADATDAEKRLREAGEAQEIALVEAFRAAGRLRRRGLVILGTLAQARRRT